MLCFSEHLWDSWSTYHAPGTGVSVAHVLIRFAIEQPEGVSRQASLSITNSWSSPRLTSIESAMPSSHLILCRPLLLLPPIPPSIRVFPKESTLHMKWPKYWSFSFSIIPSKEIPGLISFRMGVFTIHIYRWQNWGLNIFNSLLKVTLQIIFKARIQTHILLFFMFLNVASHLDIPWGLGHCWPTKLIGCYLRYTVEYYSAIWKNETTLREGTQRKTNIRCHLLVESKKRSKWTYLQNRNRFTDTENNLMVSKEDSRVRRKTN